MADKEVRLTSATGGQKGSKDAKLGGTDARAMLELAKVYGFGELKYDRFNYLKGYPWSLSIDAALRHLFAFMAGEDRDLCTVHPDLPPIHEWIKADEATGTEGCDGSGLLHTAHLAWHAIALTAFQQRGIGDDDREPNSNPVMTAMPKTEEWTIQKALAYYGIPRKDWDAYGSAKTVQQCINVDGKDCGQPHCPIHGFQP